MVTLDRRKLTAPVFAQAAAFVVVLVIGGFTGHSPKPPAQLTPTRTPTHQASPSTRSSTPTAAKGQGAKLTVKVVEEGTDGVTVSGSEVRVLHNAAPQAVAESGTLNALLEFATNVPAGAYQVCVNPPPGFTSATKNTHTDHGFICLPADVGSAPVTVTLSLASPTAQAGAGA